MTDLDKEWFDRIKGTMAIDVERLAKAGASGMEIVEQLLRIPEVAQALQWRCDRRKQPPTVFLTDAADYLDDGYHEKLVDELRGIAADIVTLEDQGAGEPWPLAEQLNDR